MAHIHTKKGEHDLTTSGYIIRTDGNKPKIMLHLHKKLNAYLQFGSHVELDEHPWSALAHEILEESGYELEQLALLQPHGPQPKITDNSEVQHPLPFHLNTHKVSKDHNHIGIDYILLTNEEPRHPLAEGESNEIVQLAADEIKGLPEDKIFSNTRALCLFALDASLSSEWRHVPASSYPT